MFFSGDPSARKRVALGGRSTKKRDRQKLLEQTRLERERRPWLRKQTSAAFKIQNASEEEKICMLLGQRYERSYISCMDQNVKILPGILLVWTLRFSIICCFSLVHAILVTYLSWWRSVDLFIIALQIVYAPSMTPSEVASLFADSDYGVGQALVDYRVKKLAVTCVQAVNKNRFVLRNQIAFSLYGSLDESCKHLTLLLEVVASLIDAGRPWVCKTVSHLLENGTFPMFREIILNGLERRKSFTNSRFSLALENVLCHTIPHIGPPLCHCPVIEPQESFISQLLTIPFLWQFFPRLKEVFAMQGLKSILHSSDGIMLTN